jgi:hypothetical protein
VATGRGDVLWRLLLRWGNRGAALPSQRLRTSRLPSNYSMKVNSTERESTLKLHSSNREAPTSPKGPTAEITATGAPQTRAVDQRAGSGNEPPRIPRMRMTGFGDDLPPAQPPVDAYQRPSSLSAIQDSALLSNITRKPFLSTCVPPNSTVTQLIHIFVSYAQSHPAGLSSPAVDLVFEALREAYPQFQCKPWTPF